MTVVRQVLRQVLRDVKREVLRADPNPFGNSFAMTIVTTGPSETFTLPGRDIGIYDADVDWTDGTPTSEITTFNDPDLAHIYANADTQQLLVSKTFPSVFFNNAGDKLKVRSIENFGSIGWLTLELSFFGCINLVTVTSNVTNFDLVTSLASAFRVTGIVIFNVLSGISMPLLTQMNLMIRNCPDLEVFDISFLDAPQNIRLDFCCVDNASMTTYIFTGTTIKPTTLAFFGQNNTLVTSVEGLDTVDISQMTNAANFMANGGSMTTAQYDAVLISFSGQTVQSAVSIHFGNSKFTSGGAAEAARSSLITNDLWVITDGGAA